MKRWLLISVASIASCFGTNGPPMAVAGEILRWVAGPSAQAGASTSPPAAAPRDPVQVAQLRSRRAVGGVASDAETSRADAINRAIDQELLNLALDRELAAMPRAIDPGRQAAGSCIYGPWPADPSRRSIGGTNYRWSPELVGLQLGGALITYVLRELPSSGDRQAIRFHVGNETVRRASIGFQIDIISNAGTQYTNMLGAMLDGQKSLSGSELEIAPFPNDECVADVRISNLMVCDESIVGSYQFGERYYDSCTPIPEATHTGAVRTRAVTLGSPPTNLTVAR